MIVLICHRRSSTQEQKDGGGSDLLKDQNITKNQNQDITRNQRDIAKDKDIINNEHTAKDQDIVMKQQRRLDCGVGPSQTILKQNTSSKMKVRVKLKLMAKL